MRKILDKTSCQICIEGLLDNIEETNSSSYLIQMDFSGSCLLQPSESMMDFFKALLATYLQNKPILKKASLSENILKKLTRLSLEHLAKQKVSLPFCAIHDEPYSVGMIRTTLKIFLKAYIHELNNIFSKNVKNSSWEKNRKLLNLSKT